MSDFSSDAMDVTRMPLARDDTVERARAARRGVTGLVVEAHGGMDLARTNRDVRRVAAADFAELLDILGLSVVPESQPGVCRRDGCEQPLSWSACLSSARNRKRQYLSSGYCSVTCWKAAA